MRGWVVALARGLAAQSAATELRLLPAPLLPGEMRAKMRV